MNSHPTTAASAVPLNGGLIALLTALCASLLALWAAPPAGAAGDNHALEVICYVDDPATSVPTERLEDPRLEDPLIEAVDDGISVVVAESVACLDIDRAAAPIVEPGKLAEHYGALPTLSEGFDRNAVVQCGNAGAAFVGVSSSGAQTKPPTGPTSLSTSDLESILMGCAGSLGPGVKDRGSFDFLNGLQSGPTIGTADCGSSSGGPYANGEAGKKPGLSYTDVALSITGHWGALMAVGYASVKGKAEGGIAKVAAPGAAMVIFKSAAADVREFMMQAYTDAARNFALYADLHADLAESVATKAQSGAKEGTDAKKHADAAAAAAAEARQHANAAQAANQRAQNSTNPREITAALKEAAEAAKKAAEAAQRALDEAKKAEEAKKKEEAKEEDKKKAEGDQKTKDGGSTSGQPQWPGLGDGACEAFNYFLWECQQSGWKTGPCQKFLQDLNALKCGWGAGSDPAPIDPLPDGPAVTCEPEPVSDEQVASAWLDACGSQIAQPVPDGDPCGAAGLFVEVVLTGDADGCEDEVANSDGLGCITPEPVEVEDDSRCPPTPPDLPPSPCVEDDPIGPGPLIVVTPGTDQIGFGPAGTPITGTPPPVAPAPEDEPPPGDPSSE